MKIGILNQKGGAGKTTIALHLAHALALNNYPVMLVDADPQGSARDWATAREGNAPFSVIGLDLVDELLQNIEDNHATEEIIEA